jgi:hypothetical protein
MSNYSKTTDFEAKDSLPTGDSGKIIRGAEFETEFDAISTAIATKADTAGPTFTGTLTFETISDGTIGVTAFVDEDNMASNSATLVPTQQSVKAYVDSQVTAQDLDFQADTGGALSIDLDSETMTFTGGTGIDTSGLGNAVTFAIDSTVATLTGTQTLTNKTLTSPDVNTPDIDGGTIDGTVIGGTTPAAVSATTVSATGNITVGGTVDGRDVATDGTKLDGIEAGATADQTAAEIRTLVEAATDSNVFTDADHSKLDGIEAGATGDQTNAEIRAAVEAATDSNVFTDADHSKLDGIEALADVTDTTNVTAAGALMDSELTNITAVKALDQGVATTDTPTFAGLATSADVSFGDNDKAVFGAGSDLQIYHDGSHSNITDVGTGNLKIKGQEVILQTGTGENSLYAATDGAVTLYHNGSAKLATTSTGIDVTGTVVADEANIGEFSTSTNVFQGNVGGTGARLRAVVSSNSNPTFSFDTDTDTGMYTAGANTLNFTTGGVQRIRLDSAGNISFYEDTGTTAKLFWDASAESLGVGTTSPSSSYAVDATAGYRSSAAIPNFTLVETDASGQTWQLNSTGAKLSFRDVSRAADRVVIDTAGNVGIGTDSPSYALHVATTAGFTAEFQNTAGANHRPVRWTDNSGATVGTLGGDFTNNEFILQGFGTPLVFGAGADGTERMRIDSSGNVGIGTSSPSGPLDVVSSSGAVGQYIRGRSSDNIGSLYFTSNASASTEYGYVQGRSTDLRIQGFNNGLILQPSSGNVGIGTSSPAAKLHVYQSANNIIQVGSAGTSTAGIDLAGDGATAGTDSYRLYQDSGKTAYVWNYANTPLRIGTNNAEAMRIDSSGNLLVGKTTTSGTTVGHAIKSNGQLESVVDGSYVSYFNRKTSAGTVSLFALDGAQVGSISVTSSATTYNTSSDQRLKDNIVDAPSASDDIDAIQVRSFDWKADGSHQKYGMVAQELQSVAPEAVSGDANSDDMMGVDYSKLVPMMMKEIQSLRARVAQLEGAN